MALILNIETATPVCSVALGDSGELLGFKESADGNSHASHLTIFISELLESCNKSLSDLDAIAVSKGPGSYTGLRIGVSTAKGLCYALDKPLISVDTLNSMASFQFDKMDESTLFCPMLDARRMEVYCAMYDVELNEVIAVNAAIIDERSFSVWFDKHKILFFGDGAEKCQPVFKSNPSALFQSDYQISATTMLRISQSKFEAEDFEDVAYFEPYYLKDFVAGPPKKLI